MTHASRNPIARPRSLALLAILLMVAATPARTRAQSQTAPKAATDSKAVFEAASVKTSPPNQDFMSFTTLYPANRFTAKNATLGILISIAYGVDSNKILNEPGWFGSESDRYDVAAKVDGDAGLTREQMQPLLQHLLEQRFHLTTHREQRELQGYALVVAKGSPKLQPNKGAPPLAYRFENKLLVQDATLRSFAGSLELPAGRPVIDKTGIEGIYDFTLKFSTADHPDQTLPDLFTALQEQFGLKLDSQKVPVDVLVIDHVDKTPTEN